MLHTMTTRNMKPVQLLRNLVLENYKCQLDVKMTNNYHGTKSI